MVKSFFIGLGTTIFWVWTLLGIVIIIMHLAIGSKGNWWGFWDWTAIMPIIFLVFWGLGKMFVGIGEDVRRGNW